MCISLPEKPRDNAELDHLTHLGERAARSRRNHKKPIRALHGKNRNGLVRELWTDPAQREDSRILVVEVMKGRRQEFRALKEAALAGPQRGSLPESSLVAQNKTTETQACHVPGKVRQRWAHFLFQKALQAKRDGLGGFKVQKETSWVFLDSYSQRQ